MILILGAGLSGLSTSYHVGHDSCLILERDERPFGHAKTHIHDGFTWDEGPHVSFTKSDYVRELFAKSVAAEFDEYEVRTGNFFRGHWIDHPAQSNFYQIPEPLRAQCLESFLESRDAAQSERVPGHYGEWLRYAFGEVFAETFPAAYTRKYWTTSPENLTTDWVGSRVFYPSVDDVIAGSKGPLSRQTHYITKVRYPKQGGYQHYGKLIAEGARLALRQTVTRIDLPRRTVSCADGSVQRYERLVSTLPLPIFVSACADAPAEVTRAAESLSCSQLLLVSVEVPHPARRDENWMYVYDEDKYATRIHFTEKLTPGNTPEGRSGIQVEVYFSRYRPETEDHAAVARKVVAELYEMGLIDRDVPLDDLRYTATWVPWANVIFDLGTRSALDTILRWLESQGLRREADDLDPITNWPNKAASELGELILAGRFGQWKYYWTDDCVLRGKYVAEMLVR